MELKVYSIDGNDTGRTVIVDDALFGTEPNDHVLWLAVKQFLANQRQGTHKSKERSEVSGSTKKLKRQKGTGGARAGDTNSPTIVGGGRAFGPRPRDYRFKLNKKVKRLARLSALYYKSKEDNGTIAIIGPKRMDYERVVGILEYIKENIETIITRQRITESPFFIVVIFLSFSL